MSASHCTKHWLAGKKVGWLAAQLPSKEEMTGCQNDQLAELAGSGCTKFCAFSLFLFAILHILRHASHGCNFVVESRGGGVIRESKDGQQKNQCAIFFCYMSP